MLMSTTHLDFDPHSASDHPFLARKPVDALAEMSAYEALWLAPSASVKSLAELFADNPGALPSDLIEPSLREDAKRRLAARLGERLSSVGVRVHGAGEYPQKLRDADHPVELLYYLGDWSLAETRCVAVVGTREPSEEGAASCRAIVRRLVRDGFTIVSGLARGIDRIAHETALECGGRTIGVIGTPLDVEYPPENAALQQRIAADHLLISQVPFLRYALQTMHVNRFFFPERNKTMSALTLGTIIVEAGETSGTLIQARAAIAQERKLFILASSFRKPTLTWPAKYEQRGAIRVESYRDIARELEPTMDAH